MCVSASLLWNSDKKSFLPHFEQRVGFFVGWGFVWVLFGWLFGWLVGAFCFGLGGVLGEGLIFFLFFSNQAEI